MLQAPNAERERFQIVLLTCYIILYLVHKNNTYIRVQIDINFTFIFQIVDCEVAKAVWMLRNVLSSTVIEQVNQTRRNMCSSTELKTFPEGNGVLNKLGTVRYGSYCTWNSLVNTFIYFLTDVSSREQF